ncbi:C40 family peptidase [Paenibacillus lemnae]|uniref:C40 family peptidase n=1 Tax=Paenibacillus lemnae TaxID=1330551 RepID=A0A848M8J6_PAELE|nr:SH3 domain-containing C40 family peptidase [Paenibacillus lemnae]NMO97367.1 C40 family peptidase [Paenibacillus lemnae]
MNSNMTSHWKKICAGALLSAAVLGSFSIGPASSADAAASEGQASGNVYLRSNPSAAGEVVARIYKGDDVSILGESGSWIKLKTAAGKTGYASSQYITAGAAASSGSNNAASAGTSSASIERVIQAGMNYLGTPYEFGSDRNTTTTFDCSDLVRQVFLEGAGIKLPASSRTQGAWIQDQGTAVYNTGDLKRGDLVFFMSYRGSSASSYAGVDKSKQTITHVGIYLGDDKLLHTYSNEAGGVLVGDFSGSWKQRFLFGGSVLK